MSEDEKGRGEFGECWRAVEMIDDYTSKSVEVQVVRRWPDGHEEPGHMLKETVAEEFKTLEAALRRAVKMHDIGMLVSVDHMPDGRSGHMGGFMSVVDAEVFRALVKAARDA